MPRTKNPELWEAMEAALRSVAHIARASDEEGDDRVSRLRSAVQESEEQRRLLEDALIEAEREAGDGDYDGGDHDNG